VSDGNPAPDADRLAAALDEWLRALEAGDAPDREAFLSRHADLVEELAPALDSVEFVHRTARDLAATGDGRDDEPAGRTLGDFRLLREVGRGGMAVVYEAEQVSLSRRVALKVLPFAGMLDPRQLQRFRNEATAAASLRHPHIVPVHGVGCEAGVHYFAMQYVEGQSLAVAIRDLRDGAEGGGPRTPISTHRTHKEAAFVRRAAELARQAADALDHAHRSGVVHRDVKPANLLVDVEGDLWVTDFGLATSMTDASLTATGELVGTVRYMSPEQALAKGLPVDHRTDVYSLGATLYELLTLEPAFPGDDLHAVLRDVASREPVALRRWNPVVPADLETVVRKAMSKDPAGRYATARDFADDLGRFLDGRPVKAQRPSVVARASAWGRRHRGLVAAAAVALVAAVGVLVADDVRVSSQRDRAEENLRLARDAVDLWLVEAGAADYEDRPLPVPAKRKLLESALRFYEAREEDGDSLRRRVTILHALHRWADALAAFDRLTAGHPNVPEALADRAHFLWHMKRHDEALATLDRAIEIDRRSGVAWFFRALVLSALKRGPAALDAAKRATDLNANSPAAWVNLGGAQRDEGLLDDAVASFQKAIALEPLNVHAYTGLSWAYEAKGDGASAVKAYLAAQRHRPDDAELRNDLGLLRRRLKDLPGAERDFRDAIAIDANLPAPRENLGDLLRERGEFAEAVVHYRVETQVMPQRVPAWVGLSAAYGALHRLPEAIDACRKALEIDPENVGARLNLAHALGDSGKRPLAIAEYERVLASHSDEADAWFSVAGLYEDVGAPAKAIDAYRRAVALRGDDPEFLCNLGLALHRNGRSAEAIEPLRKGHAIGSRQPGWRYPSAEWVHEAEQAADVAAKEGPK
jgi:tetratricopeptide (TPR) repeat protein